MLQAFSMRCLMSSLVFVKHTAIHRPTVTLLEQLHLRQPLSTTGHISLQHRISQLSIVHQSPELPEGYTWPAQPWTRRHMCYFEEKSQMLIISVLHVTVKYTRLLHCDMAEVTHKECNPIPTELR